MRSNVSVLTANAQTIIGQSVVDYQNAVAAHVAGDWAKHNQLRFYSTPFTEPVSSDVVTSAYQMRLSLSGINADGSGDGIFVIPAITTSVVVDVGSAPVILQQPGSYSVYTGTSVSFVVVAASATTMTYQWKKNGTDITGATAATYTIASTVTTDAGSFTVVVTNIYGSVTSAVGTLAVTAAPVSSPGSTGGVSGGGCFTAGTKITLADGTTRNIEDLIVGDQLKSYIIGGLDPNSETSYIAWTSAVLNLVATTVTVINTIKATYSGYYKILDLNVTYDHPLLVRRNGIWQFLAAAQIVPGDALWKGGLTIPITTIEQVNEYFDAYNLNVEVQDVYLANGFIAHNVEKDKN